MLPDLHDSVERRQRLVRVARGEEPADLVITGGRVALPLSGEVISADIAVAGGRVAGFGGEYRGGDRLDVGGAFVTAGFIDAHIHIESSMLTPARFAEAVVPRGTTSVVAEPHEIANVLGVPGVAWMLEAGRSSGMRVYASMPSCVPASAFESGGATLKADDVRSGLALPGVLGLAEMMNYPGVLGADAGVWSILDAARSARVDGHAAGLTGRDLQAYAAAGMHSDHEAVTPEQALERLRAGLWLMVREGSAARNLAALLPVLRQRPRRAMLVSDDVSVDELLDLGHLDRHLRACVAGGLDPLYALGLVTHAPAEYWGLHDHGVIAPGAVADLVVLDDLVDFRVRETLVGGVVARPGGRTPPLPGGATNLGPDWDALDLSVPDHWPVIGVSGDQIETSCQPSGTGDTRLVVAERHAGVTNARVAWASGIHLQRGALALSVLHDAHHAIIAGASDGDIRAAGRALEAQGGGAVFVEDGQVRAALPLTVGGLMTDAAPELAARQARDIADAARACGCQLPQPITTLSFLGLTVIPELKLTPAGLLDVRAWSMVE